MAQVQTELNRTNYIDQRNACASLSIEKQKSYYAGMISNSSNSQKSLFKIVNETLDKRSERVLPSYTDAIKLANDFNTYYIEKVSQIRDSICTVQCARKGNLFSGQCLTIFAPVTDDELTNLIKEHGIKTSAEDPLPANILKRVIGMLIPCFRELINKSLVQGSIEGVKSSVIDPLLKQSNLNNEIFKNYRPVNNLVFFSKLIERVVLARLNNHMTEHALHTREQFGYKKYHSTETMMLGIVNDILKGFDEQKATVVIFLDLSAAFDTIDIPILLQILHDDLGVRGVALKWLKSFLTDRVQRVRVDSRFSRNIIVE